MYNKLQFMLLYWMLNIDIESLKGTRQHVQRERGGERTERRKWSLSFMAPWGGSVNCHSWYAWWTCYICRFVCVPHSHMSLCVWLYVCYQWVQKVSCLISLNTWGPWECLSLSLLIKHQEKQQQRQHRIRKEAKGKHKEGTIKDMKENRFMCIQQYWCERKN